MANCNCNDFPISCAPHAPGGDCCHPHGCPPHPCPPPPFKGGTSMYIGARYVPIFADPVEWDDEREYEPLTIVIHNGDCYTSKCYVPKGAQLPPYPEGQTKYWVKTSDYNYQFADLKKTVSDLSRLVEQFQKDNEHFTELINGWNEKVIQWEKDMTAWGERLDTVESNVADLTASLNAEIDRAKAAEQANAAAIAQETADRQQAISDLDAAYKAADAAEAQARAEADTALGNRITANKTDIDAIKAEQVIQNTNISNNAKNIADNSAEIAKHAARLTSLESNASDWDEVFPNTTIAQEMQKEETARTNADTALNGRCDTIAADVEEVRDIANHKVDTTVYTAGQAAQDARITAAQNAANKANTTIGDWDTEHPHQTISQCATSLENEIAAVDTKADANAANIGDWRTKFPEQTIAQAVADVRDSIPDVSGFVLETDYSRGQAAQNTNITAAQNAANKANTTIGNWDVEHPGKTISQAVTALENVPETGTAFPKRFRIPLPVTVGWIANGNRLDFSRDCPVVYTDINENTKFKLSTLPEAASQTMRFYLTTYIDGTPSNTTVNIPYNALAAVRGQYIAYNNYIHFEIPLPISFSANNALVTVNALEYLSSDETSVRGLYSNIDIVKA